jgi:prepilin-type N-terminal cleavage/methylation domain-containing protein
VRARRGFTLIEMVMVVAIIGVATALAFNNITREKERASVEDTVRDLRARIEHVRTLATQLGPRVGNPQPGDSWTYNGCGPAALVAGGPGLGPGGLWVSLSGTSWFAPDSVTLTAGGAGTNTTGMTQISVTCVSGDLQQKAARTSPSVGNYTVIAAPPVLFGFTSSGRLMSALGTPFPAPIQAIWRQQTDAHPYGFAILPSGILCTSDAVVAAGNNPCMGD